MKINKRELISLIANTPSTLPRLESSVKISKERVICFFNPIYVPGLAILIYSTHTRVQLFQHLYSMWFIKGTIRKSEQIFSQLLSLVSNPTRATILKFISLRNNFLKRELRMELHQKLIDRKISQLPINPQAYATSFEPGILIRSMWMDKKRFPPKAFIGKGHQSSSTLSNGLAWQDQMLGEEEEGRLCGEIELLLSLHTVTLPSVPGSENPK